MVSQQEVSTELSPEIFPSLSPEKATILKSAKPSLFALLENDEFNQGPEEELFGTRCGLVFETLAREEFHSLRGTPKPFRRLEELIIRSMGGYDIGFLGPPGLVFHRPDILVMEYEQSSQIVTITQIGEIKLGLWGLSGSQLERVLEQRRRLFGDLKQFLKQVADFRNNEDLKSLVGQSIKQIKLLSKKEGFQSFYILPCAATIPPSMKDWEIDHSDFSQQDIERITQALLETPRFKNV